MYHLDEVRPQYYFGGNNPKKKQTKKQSNRKDPRPNNASRQAYEQDYSNYVINTPQQKINGVKINTSDFEQFPSYLSYGESGYNPNAENDQGYQGYYGIDKMKGKPGKVQHDALFRHIEKGVRSMTREDLKRARKLGWNDAQILQKMHLFPMGVADYVWSGLDRADDNGTRISTYGNEQPPINVLDRLITNDAIQGDYYILNSGESIGKIADYVRIEGQPPSNNIPYLLEINANKYNNRRKMSLKGETKKSKRKLSKTQLKQVDDILLNAGDTVYLRK